MPCLLLAEGADGRVPREVRQHLAHCPAVLAAPWDPAALAERVAALTAEVLPGVSEFRCAPLAGRLGGWAAGRLGGWAAGRLGGCWLGGLCPHLPVPYLGPGHAQSHRPPSARLRAAAPGPSSAVVHA